MPSKKTLLMLLVLLGVSAAPAFCQGSQVNSVTGVPDSVIYKLFFRVVLWYDGQAGGLGPAAMRSVIQQQAGLTAAEAASLVSVAKDWRSSDSSIEASIQALAATGAPANSAQGQGLAAQAGQNVLDHVAQLQGAFGPARFSLLDLYVRRKMQIAGPGATFAGHKSRLGYRSRW